MADTISQNEVFPETILNDNGLQTIKNKLDSVDNHMSTEISNLNITSLNSNEDVLSPNDDYALTEISNFNSNLLSGNEIHCNSENKCVTTEISNLNSNLLSNSECLLSSDNRELIETSILNDHLLNNDEVKLSSDNDTLNQTSILNDHLLNNDEVMLNSDNDTLNQTSILNDHLLNNDEVTLNSDNDALNETSTLNENVLINNEVLNTNNHAPTEISSNNNFLVDTSATNITSQCNQDLLDKEYKIGDIVWAKIGKYPFWPSVVCVDPKSKMFLKRFKEKRTFSLHVRFCNDKGRRSWTKTIENYIEKDKLISKYPNCLSYIKNSKNLMNTWNSAIEEANNLLKLDGELRIIEFFKTFLNSNSLDPLTSSALNLSSEGTSTTKLRTYSRKRSLTTSAKDINFKLIKTENISVNGSMSSRSIDIPLLSRSDDADSTVSDNSMSYAFMNDGLNIKQEIIKKRRSTKTYPPKSSINNYNLSDLMGSSPDFNDDNSILSDNHNQLTTSSIDHTIPTYLNLIENIEKGNRISSHSRRSKRSIIIKSNESDKAVYSSNSHNTNSFLHSQSPLNSKKKISKKKSHGKETSTGRKLTVVKSESSPEPDTTESEASSKNETYITAFLASRKNKQLFVKTLKRACVVCKNIEDTIKCMGSCQSYFHKECLAKSEERYYKSEPKIKIKKTPGKRSKRRYSKLKLKAKEITSTSQMINNINEECTVELIKKDNDLVSMTLIEMKSVSKEQCSSHIKEENSSYDHLESEVQSMNSNYITENENSLEQNQLDNLDEDIIQEVTDEKVVETLIKPKNISLPNDKASKIDLQFLCSLCKTDKINCFACGLEIDDPGQKIVCKISNCGKYYHEKCLEDWPQCQWTQGLRNNVRCIVCPHHVCHLCISDNPKSACKTHFPSEKLTRCIKCPTAYHRSEYCLPAGSKVLTYFDIICSRHFEPSKIQKYHYNATWCFICTLGGALVCCDLCPSSFHIECLNQNPSEFEGGFTCEECQTGRYPLYGEIVWVKIGKYRWWPAQIVFPDQVPDSVNAISHSVGEFAVRFFGSYDYYWVNRGRVFNFHEGDDENILMKNIVKVIDQVFQDAIIEAAQAHNAYILAKDKNDAIVAKKSLTKPPKFVRIKFNKPFGNVKNMEFDNTPMTSCECDPTKPDPCGPDSDCINRMLMFECHPQLCPAGNKCNNQRFEKTLYPSMEPFLTKGRGWGLKTLEDIKEGSFVIEYVGDVIDEDEFQKRCLEMHKRNEQNYYFLTIDNSRMIDAGPKGNLSRFMNHSCEPNCVTQKWTVNGDTRIGLFALHNIPAGTELVFDYRLQSCSGVEKKPCQCGATRCSRFIGVKVEEEKKKVISINDPDKYKTSTKSKRKPLKLKDNVSDSDKLKLTKVTNNNQNISTIENEVDSSSAEKIDDSKKAKTRASFVKPSTILKNENLESSETPTALKRKWKNATKNNINMTKDVAINSLELEETVKSKRKQRNSLSTSSREQLIKKNVIKSDIIQLLKNSTDSSIDTTLYSSENTCGIMENDESIKTISVSKLAKPFVKSEQCHDTLEVDKEFKINESIKTQERCRHSLTRLAKSRHSFLSKNDFKRDSNEQCNVSMKKFNKEKYNTTTMVKKNCEEMKKAFDIKKNNMNNYNLLSKMYYKNDSCLICGKGHAELACKNKKCPRVFHLSCMNKSKIVKSGFICPSHFCSVCKKRKVVAKCKFCIESFCTTHVKGNIFKDPLGNGMLCITHHPIKKSTSVASTSKTPTLTNTNKTNVISKHVEPTNFSGSNIGISMPGILPDIDEEHLNTNTDETNEEEYTLTQVIKDECDREYIHIGGFNVCNMPDLATDKEESYIAPVDTDGDLFKPSSANVVIDIESASTFYQSSDSLQLVSIAAENKDNHDYANVHFVPDFNQTKIKWLAAEP